MKTRQGFVSNSSSSSYIIRTDKTTWDFAKDMLRKRELDYAEDNIEDENLDVEERIRTIESLNLPVDTPFTMNSVQYSTYIFKMNGKIYVDTCNNIVWSIEDLESKAENYINVYDDGSEHYGDGLHSVIYDDILFFHLDYLIVAKEAPYDLRDTSKCKEHYNKLQLPDGSIICPICDPPIPITPFELPKVEFIPPVNRLEIID